MITFGRDGRKLTSDRKTPDVYDMLHWDMHTEFELYNDHVINKPYNVGWEYHIILYRKPIKVLGAKPFLEIFDACLIDPLEYAETIAGRYYGIIGKKSDKSAELFQTIYKCIEKDGDPVRVLKIKEKKWKIL